MKDDIISIVLTAVFGFFYLIWAVIKGIFNFFATLVKDVLGHTYKRIVIILSGILLAALLGLIAHYLSR